MATRTILDTGGDWSSALTWFEGAVPTVADSVVATATSGNVTIDTTTCTCLTLILTDYVGTLTFTAGQILTVSTTVTFVAGMTIAGTGTLKLLNNATITSAGKTFTGSIALDAGTWTLADDWTVVNLISQVSTNTINGNNLYITGDLTVDKFLQGTTILNMIGTGTIAVTGTGAIYTNLVINTAGTITMGALFFWGSTGKTLTYTAGTVDTTTNSCVFKITNDCSINSGAITWYDISFLLTAGRTVVLQSDLLCSHDLTITTTADILTISGAYNISCANLYVDAGTTLKIVSGQTLTITNSIAMRSSFNYGDITIQSVTASSSFNLTYNGIQANCAISGVIFTDVVANVNLFNWGGGALTRTTKIYNVTGADYPEVNDVRDTTVYAGGALTGTYVGGGVSSDVFGIIG